MGRTFAIRRRLLVVLMIAGLVLAPLSRPVMAGDFSDVSMQAMAADMAVSAMPAETDMPCCPSKAQAPLECDKCVFMACMSKCFTGMSTALFDPSFAPSDNIAPRQNDFLPDGLGHPPPEYPPRILV